MKDGYTVVGVNSDCDTCTCCGKTNLKRVVWLSKDGAAPEPVGTNCAAMLLRTTATRVERAAEDADRARDKAARETVHMVGDARSVRPFTVEAVGQCGAVVTFLALANGLKSAVQKWADERWPFVELNIR